MSGWRPGVTGTAAMVDASLAWLFGLNPVPVWFGGGLVCGAMYWVAVPDSDDPRENRDRAFVAGGLVIIWPSVLIWLGPDDDDSS